MKYGHLILLCGHYEGVDQRAIDMYIDEEISIGDYVLTGGELPAMVVCDCVARYVDGVISDGSLADETFGENGLEYRCPYFKSPNALSCVKVAPLGDIYTRCALCSPRGKRKRRIYRRSDGGHARKD